MYRTTKLLWGLLILFLILVFQNCMPGKTYQEAELKVSCGDPRKDETVKIPAHIKEYLAYNDKVEGADDDDKIVTKKLFLNEVVKVVTTEGDFALAFFKDAAKKQYQNFRKLILERFFIGSNLYLKKGQNDNIKYIVNLSEFAPEHPEYTLKPEPYAEHSCYSKEKYGEILEQNAQHKELFDDMKNEIADEICFSNDTLKENKDKLGNALFNQIDNPEFIPHDKYIISSVPTENSADGSKRSSGSKFIIMTDREPSFDKQRTVFAAVIRGFDTIDKIANLPTTQSEIADIAKPIKNVTINEAYLFDCP